MRVLVTRPRLQAEATVRRLAALGIDGVAAPVLEVAPTGQPRPAGSFDAVILTSANAALSLQPADRESSLPVFAVGRRTADAAIAAGLRHVVSADGAATDLARAVRALLPAGAALLHIAGRDRKPEPARSLESAGYRVAVWASYEARASTCLPEAAADALRRRSVQAALHYSARSASHLVHLAHAAGLAPALADLAHACLSADVAASLEAIGPTRLSVAAEPDEASLFAALSGFVPQGSRPPQSGC